MQTDFSRNIVSVNMEFGASRLPHCPPERGWDRREKVELGKGY